MTDRATVRCLDCNASASMPSKVCKTCRRPFVDMGKLAVRAFEIEHAADCPNRELAAVRQPDGTIACHRLVFEGPGRHL